MGIHIGFGSDNDPETPPGTVVYDFSAFEQLTRAAQTAHDCWTVTSVLRDEIENALSDLDKARRAIESEKAPQSKPTATTLTAYTEEKRTNRQQLAESETRVDALLARFLASSPDRQAKYSAFDRALQKVESEKPPEASLPTRARAVLVIARRVHEIVTQGTDGGGEAYTLTSFKQRRDGTTTSDTKTAPKVKTPKRPAGPRKKYEALIDALGRSLKATIETYEKTRVAREEARFAVEVVSSLDSAQIVEPQKPTAEEVGRYLHELDMLARKHIPAQRQAAANILTFRRYMTALDDAIKDLAPAVRKTSHLEALDLSGDDEAIVVGAREILETLRVQYREFVRSADDWVARKYDNSTEVTETFDDEKALMEQLQVQVRNLGNAIANKAIARAKYDQLKNIPAEHMPEMPTWNRYAYLNVDERITELGKYLVLAAAVNARNEKQNAIKMVAFDAFEARQELARRLAGSLAGIATTIERTLQHPMSDELRVRLFAIRKLHMLTIGYRY